MLNFDNISGLKIYLKFQQKAIPDNLSLCKLIILHKKYIRNVKKIVTKNVECRIAHFTSMGP